MSTISYCEKWWPNHWKCILCGDHRPPMVWFQKDQNKGLQHLVNLNAVCVDALEHTFVTRSGHKFALLYISSVFPLVCETVPKNDLFTVWYLRYCSATFLPVSGDIDLDCGYLVVAVKTEDDVCSLECKQEVLQLRAVQCGQASVRLANSGILLFHFLVKLFNRNDTWILFQMVAHVQYQVGMMYHK